MLRVEEDEREGSVFYYKVDRQMKEVREIVLSIRIRPLLCVCEGAWSMASLLKLDHDLDVHLT